MTVTRGPGWPAGHGLTELLVAMTIGLVLIAGATVMHQRTSTALRTAESLARLQDVARMAFDVIEADVRMASYWGLLGRPDMIVNRAVAGAALPAAFTAAQGVRIDLCGGAGSRWAINLDAYLDGFDDTYGLACAPVNAAQPGSDTLILRRAAELPPASLDASRVHVQTSHTGGALFVPSPGCTDPADGSCLPAGFAPGQSQSRALIARAYYVARSSTQRPDVPALRRKSMGNVNAVNASDALTDEEIATGVENLQVLFGIDQDGDGKVDLQVHPGAVPSGATVLSATIWLRIRSEDPQPAHVDGATYQYAGMAHPFVPADSYRRMVVTRTIRIRNARP